MLYSWVLLAWLACAMPATPPETCLPPVQDYTLLPPPPHVPTTPAIIIIDPIMPAEAVYYESR